MIGGSLSTIVFANSGFFDMQYNAVYAPYEAPTKCAGARSSFLISSAKSLALSSIVLSVTTLPIHLLG
jgi:hypothetical protein